MNRSVSAQQQKALIPEDTPRPKDAQHPPARERASAHTAHATHRFTQKGSAVSLTAKTRNIPEKQWEDR